MGFVFTDAGGYVDDAVDGLAQGHVFVSSEVDGAAALTSSLQQQISDASIGVAVFSDNAALEASGPEIVSQLAERTGYDTIIVAVGGDLSAGSRVIEPAGEAMRMANQAEGSATSVGQALTETIQSVVAASDQPSPAAGSDGGPLIGVVLVVVALVAVVGVTWGVVRGRRSRADGAGRGLPDEMRAHVAALRALSGEYDAVGARGNGIAAQTGAEIAVIAANVTELFARLGRRNDEQSGIAATEYDDKLRKLTAALDRDYLLDILTHPNLWDDPGGRIDEVRGAVTAVSEELVENIKQVNARRGLQFQVSLDGLIGGRKELRDWERQFDDASGDGPAN
ncbi:hypothetical protein [Microbacterium sp. P03]|uniref:hypothetical protein n=1 Tax=Microbacterium sp. P03 TaxID=3366946 RepID=UPI0037468896